MARRRAVFAIGRVLACVGLCLHVVGLLCPFMDVCVVGTWSINKKNKKKNREKLTCVVSILRIPSRKEEKTKKKVCRKLRSDNWFWCVCLAGCRYLFLSISSSFSSFIGRAFFVLCMGVCVRAGGSLPIQLASHSTRLHLLLIQCVYLFVPRYRSNGWCMPSVSAALWFTAGAHVSSWKCALCRTWHISSHQ